MRKAIKILVSFLGLLIFLLFGTIVALPILINPNNFKPQITELVREHTGRDLTIEGDLKLSIWPWLRVETGKVQLNNRIGFNKTQPFARITQLELKIKPIPLLSKRLEIDTIWIKGLVLNLEKNAHGINNWEDFAQTTESDQITQTAETINTTAPFTPTNIIISHVVIEDTNIVWQDLTTHQLITLNPLKLQLDNIGLDSVIDLQLNVTLNSQKPEIKQIATITAKLMVNETLSHIQIDDIHLDTQTEGKIVADTKVKAAITLSSLDFDLSQDLIKLKPVSINIDAQIAGNTIPGNQQAINLSTSAALDLAQQTLSLSMLKLNAGELEIIGNITGKQILGTPQFKGQLHLPSLNPIKLMKQLSLNIPETKDANVLTRLAGQFNFNTTQDQATLNDIVIHLDDSHLSGTAQVKDFQQPAIRFDLALDQIDIDRYVKSPEQIINEPLNQPIASILDNTLMLTRESLHNLDLQGNITIKLFRINELTLQNIKVKIQ